jgi:hypothetical protein
MHYTDVICVTPDFWKLPEGHLLGILAHEVGHLLSSAEEHTEEEADETFTTHFGIFITYRDSPHGKRLQYLSPAWARQFRKTFHVDHVKKYIELKVK